MSGEEGTVTSVWSVELETPVSAKRMFHAAVLDWHNVGPKVMPHIMVSATLEGDVGVGGVQQFNYVPAMPFTFVRERIDILDREKFECLRTATGGGGLGITLESASGHFLFEPRSDGGSLCKIVVNYKPLPGIDISGDMGKTKGAIGGYLKATEAYLLANPDVYA